MHEDTINLLVERLNKMSVRELHDKDFSRQQVVDAIERYEGNHHPRTPLEAAIKQFMTEFRGKYK